VFTGCGKDAGNGATPNPSIPSTPSAPVTKVEGAPAPTPAPAGNGYVGAMVKAQQAAVRTADLSSLNEAIKMFNVQEGRLPADLNELVTKDYIGKIPAAPAGMKLVYDAAQGKVTAAPQ
jgi:hypothetical protein